MSSMGSFVRSSLSSFAFPLLLILLLLLLHSCSFATSASSPLDCDNPNLVAHDDPRINDGYCDCPDTGADEPYTAACAGSSHWPGGNDGKQQTAPLLFACPQQPTLQLPLSRLHDGICDCCDGVDEAPNVCVDECAQLLAAQRAAAAEQLEHYQKGAVKRSRMVQAFGVTIQRTKAELTDARVEHERLEAAGARLHEQIGFEKVFQWKERKNQSSSSIAALVSQLTSGLVTTDALVWFLVHLCQLTGELPEDLRDERKTCVPLRLAGLDVGLVWAQGTYEPLQVGDDEAFLASAWDHNVQHRQATIEMVWTREKLAEKGKKKNGNTRRRLEEEDYLDEDYDEDEDYEDWDVEEDDPEEEERERQRRAGDKNDAADKRQALYDLISQRPLSTNRMHILEVAQQHTSTIHNLEAQDRERKKKKREKDKEDGEAEEEEEEEEDAPDHDPAAFPMLKKLLVRRRRAVERGMDYAISAKVLLDELVGKYDGDVDSLLRELAVAALAHSKLSLLHYWYILSFVVDGLQAEEHTDDKTCGPAWSCPPRSLETGNGSYFPSPSILATIQAACTQAALSPDYAESCKVDGTSENASGLPTDIPDGFEGYFLVEPREESDFLHLILGELELNEDEVRRETLSKLEDEAKTVESDQTAKKEEIQEMELLVKGGGKGKEYLGPDGELYAMKGVCHNIEAGKYVYEVCPFGSAQQKEGHDGKGTDLGKWTGASIDDETGKRIWKWEKGAKCWNGPKRSATVYVTCGADDVILSADEPDTCSYVFEMRSYLACDDKYREQHGLPAAT